MTQGTLLSFSFSVIFLAGYNCNKILYTHRSIYRWLTKTVINTLNIITKLQQNITI